MIKFIYSKTTSNIYNIQYTSNKFWSRSEAVWADVDFFPVLVNFRLKKQLLVPMVSNAIIKKVKETNKANLYWSSFLQRSFQICSKSILRIRKCHWPVNVKKLLSFVLKKLPDWLFSSRCPGSSSSHCERSVTAQCSPPISVEVESSMKGLQNKYSIFIPLETRFLC